MSYCTPGEAASLDASLEEEDITPEMLQWADGAVDDHLGRTYVQEVEVTEKVDGNDSPTIRVAHSPVTAVSSVLVEETTQPASTWVFYADGRISLQPLPEEFEVDAPTWPEGRQNVSVTYKYGTVAGARIPAHVQFAAAQVTAVIAKHAKMSLLGGVSEDWKVGAVTIKAKADKQLSATIREVLVGALGPRPPLIV